MESPSLSVGGYAEQKLRGKPHANSVEKQRNSAIFRRSRGGHQEWFSERNAATNDYAKARANFVLPSESTPGGERNWGDKLADTL